MVGAPGFVSSPVPVPDETHAVDVNVQRENATRWKGFTVGSLDEVTPRYLLERDRHDRHDASA
jgi:hypothetical protein